MGRRVRVCLLLEGTYPFITGGVSAWVHDLINGIPEADFILVSISPEKNMEYHYRLPDNVVEHKDIVITKPCPSKKTPKEEALFFGELKKTHDVLFSRGMPALEKLLNLYPEGYSLSRDSVNSTVGWDMITSANQIRNPLYPFADYFWAWKSAHDMLFTVIGASLPEADVYHAVSTGFAGMAAVAGKLRKKKPFILTEHGLYHKEREMEIRKSQYIRGYQRDMWIKMYTRFSQLCYNYADMIITLFEENRKKQINLGAPERNSFVIPNGIDVLRYKVNRKPRPGFHVGLIGRVVPIKDIKTFIATAKSTLGKIPDAKFYCIGPTDEDKGYYEECLSLVKSLRLEDNFVFTGRDDVLNYYSFLDVVLLTSVREAQPLVILEAYMAGIPVVATRVGNIPEMLDFDTNLLAPPKNAGKLTEGILFIHENPDIVNEMRTRNREKVLSRYNKKELHLRYLEIYLKYGGK